MLRITARVDIEQRSSVYLDMDKNALPLDSECNINYDYQVLPKNTPHMYL